tara:strand:- start:288 stop:575 length:288 start_codon:yes stop_codon:yes gene_type:complete
MNKIVNGVVIPLTDIEIAEFNAKKPTDAQITAQKWELVRIERNRRLQESDWRAMSDLTLSDDWKTYRQALRDVPTQSDPDNIEWPNVPGAFVANS